MADVRGGKYLAELGQRVLDNGYLITPIMPGKKRPFNDDWTNEGSTAKDLRRWLKESKGRYGIGVKTKETPGVDIDSMNPDMVEHMIAWVRENIGWGHIRLGKAPKTLMMFRTDEPFPKDASSRWTDPDYFFNDIEKPIKSSHRVEILGDGQQFVAYHLHPDTKRPYTWPDDDGPADCQAEDLPTITAEQARAICEEFDRKAEELGWERIIGKGLESLRVARINGSKVNGHRIDRNDPFMTDTAKTQISDEELERKLMLIPGNDDYDLWLQIGMALYHQYDGNDQGLELWHQWSESANNYSREALNDRWEGGSFDIEGKKRQPTTARIILRLAKEHETEVAREIVSSFKERLTTASVMEEVRNIAEEIKISPEIDHIGREVLAFQIKEKFKKLEGAAIGIGMARSMVRLESQDRSLAPEWLEGWAYVSGEDSMYHLENGNLLKPSAFNNTFSRYLLTDQERLEGKSRPEQLPIEIALNLVKVPRVDRLAYMPAEDTFFSMNGKKCVNTFRDRDIPEMPEKPSKAERRAMELVIQHLQHLIPNDRDRQIFMSHMAYPIKTMKRSRWAVLIQGTEGDGKTTLAKIMALCLGPTNVNLMNAKTVEATHNSWAEGYLYTVLNEIKMHGHNRFDIINQIKPLITDDTVEIHAKYKSPYLTVNTTSYMLMTNFADGMPITDNDRRYFVIRSRWQTKEEIEEFLSDNPGYFERLHDAMDEYPGAIRKLFYDLELHPEFNPQGRAPNSSAKDYTIAMTRSPELTAIQEILEDSDRLDVSSMLLDTSLLGNEFSGHDVVIPQTTRLRSILSEAGFTYLGRFKIEGEKRQYWSKTPDKFLHQGAVSPDKVRAFLRSKL
jgi:hypothetical protein